MEGEQAMTLTCSGSSCELLESTLGVSYPCSMTQWVEAAWAEEPS